MFDAWELSGSVILTYQDWPCELRYRVRCGADWHTVEADVEGQIGKRAVRVQVRVDDEHRWYQNDIECKAVAGSTDIDLGFSPSTNLLPIRRLALEIGAEASMRAAGTLPR